MFFAGMFGCGVWISPHFSFFLICFVLSDDFFKMDGIWMVFGWYLDSI